MTTTTATTPEVGPAPALTQSETERAVACPLCGSPAGESCDHHLSRQRATLRLQAYLQR